jgi:hypothetical protein
MAKLSRIHFAGMGNSAARFNPLTLDFRDAKGTPAHSVLWLRNGGGKTTMLSLFYSVILPKKGEWLGKFHEKPTQLGDYMLDREVGYVLIEFIFADGTRRIVGHSMVKRSADEVSRFCFTCQAEGPVTLESLPVVGLSATPAKTREAFFDYLENENRRHPKAVDLVKFDLAQGYGDWERHLIDIGIDPAVYRSHLVMNSDEGGLGEFFNFKTSDKFLEKLLEMADEPTALPDDAAGVDQAEAVVDKFRSKVLAMPDLEREARFCQLLVAGATQYRVAVAAAGAARQRLLGAREQAARALHSVTVIMTESEEQQKVLNVSLKLANADSVAHETTIGTHSRYQLGYERLSIQHRFDEATAAQLAARAASNAAEHDLAILRAAEKLAACVNWSTQVQACKSQLAELLANRRPEIAAVEALGATLFNLLNGRVGAVASAIATTRGAIAENQQRAVEGRQKQKEAGARLSEFQKTLAAVNENLKAYERERRALREDGLLEEGETAPNAAQRFHVQIEELTARISRLRDEAGRLRSSARDLRAESKRQVAAAHEEERKADTPRSHLRDSTTEASDLRTHRLIQQHGGTVADLHNPGLVLALQAEVDSLSAEIVSKAVGRAADERILSRHTPPHRPIFPVPLGVERVMEALRKGGVRSALPRYEWIAANYGLGEAERLLRENPSAAAGILLQDPVELTLVTPIVTAEGIDAPVVVSLVNAGHASDAASHVIIPAERGYFNAEAAAANRGIIQERVNSSRQGQDRLNSNRAEVSRLAERLSSYASKYSAERLEALATDIANHEAAAKGLQEAALAADTQADSLDARATALNDEVTLLTDQKGLALTSKSRVDKYVSDYHNRIEGWRATEKQASDGVKEQSRILGELEVLLTGLETQLEALRVTLTQQNDDHSRARQRRDAVPDAYRHGTVLSGDKDLSALETEFQFKREALERVLNESGLQDRLRHLEQQVTEAENSYHAYITVKNLRDADVRAAKDLHADLPAALREQDKARDDAKSALTLADHEMSVARKAKDDLPPLLRDQRATVHPEWPEAKTRAEADAAVARAKEIVRRAREDKEQTTKRIDDLKNQITEVKGLISALKPWGGDLLARAGGQVASVGHGDFKADAETAPDFLRSIRDEVDAQLRQHREMEGRADKIYQESIDSVLKDTQFASSRLDARARIVELAGARAQFDHQLEDIISNLTKRLEVIAHSQAAIDAERDIVMSAMERRGASAISLLRSAQSLSEMPVEIPAWAGEPFMKFSVPEKRDLGERRSYLRRLLDYWITSNVAIPSGHRMAFDCLLALVGSLDQSGQPQSKGVITVTIFKPEANLRRYYHDILAMRTFSGGELVTAAIILYCVMARLRAKRRGADTQMMGRDSGFLLLDNPVGKANLPDFLDLQIRIADIVGVQYICGTGINDIEALGAFPKVIRLRNSSISRSGAYVVKLEQEAFNPVTSVSVGARTPIPATAKPKEQP